LSNEKAELLRLLNAVAEAASHRPPNFAITFVKSTGEGQPAASGHSTHRLLRSGGLELIATDLPRTQDY
jgi:hypothetical protein